MAPRFCRCRPSVTGVASWRMAVSLGVAMSAFAMISMAFFGVRTARVAVGRRLIAAVFVVVATA
jgi:hypothetical protein